MITMKFPFAKLFKKPSNTVPAAVLQQLSISFPGAKNVEWESKHDYCEAIFYLNDVEYIAQISKKGNLIEYRKNLWIAELPETVKKSGMFHGEIMNGIFISKNNESFYELIIRNDQLDRYEFLFDAKGTVLKSCIL